MSEADSLDDVGVRRLGKHSNSLCFSMSIRVGVVTDELRDLVMVEGCVDERSAEHVIL